MSNFENLPIELVLEIIKFSAPEKHVKGGLRQLRLVSRSFHALATPYLFDILRLEFDDADTEDTEVPLDSIRCQEIILALASGQTTAFEHTKKLSFCTQKLNWSTANHESLPLVRETVSEHLYGAICALKNLQTVNWFYNTEHDGVQVPNSLIKALSTIPTFENFDEIRFNGDPGPEFSFRPLANLRSFQTFWGWEQPPHMITQIADLFSRSPNLENVFLGGGPSSTGNNATLSDILAKTQDPNIPPLPLKRLRLHNIKFTREDFEANKRHFRKLECLEIAGSSGNGNGEETQPDFNQLGQVCRFLKENEIFLNGFATDFVSDPLIIDYLLSYSGLEYLKVEGRHRNDQDPEVVNRVFMKIIPKHSGTLRKLELGNNQSSVWSEEPTVKQVKEIGKCKKLRKLGVHWSIDQEMLNKNDYKNLRTWFDVASQLPELEKLQLYPLALNGRMHMTMQKLMEIRRFASSALRKMREGEKLKFKTNYD